MELNVIIENYLYEVTRRLPEKQRKDIENELHGLIEDMLNERVVQGEASVKDLEAVLNELGKPRELAEKYRDRKSYLIGPEYYDKYVDFLKIVLSAVLIGSTATSLIMFVTTPQTSYLNLYGEVISSVITSLFQAFAFVTFGFAIAERSDKSTKKEKDEWSVHNLAKIPRKKEIIKKPGPIVSIVFIIIVIMLFNFYPQYIGMVRTADNHTAYSVFDLNTLSKVLPVINTAFFLGIIRETVKLIKGRYTLSLAFVTTALNIISLLFIIYAFIQPDLYNPQLSEEMADILPLLIIKGKNIMSLDAPLAIVGMFTLAYVLDSGTDLYRGIMSGKYTNAH